MSVELPRHTYARMYGPTMGDRVRLADTALVLEVEEDRTIYGEEVKFGGGKRVHARPPCCTRSWTAMQGGGPIMRLPTGSWRGS